MMPNDAILKVAKLRTFVAMQCSCSQGTLMKYTGIYYHHKNDNYDDKAKKFKNIFLRYLAPGKETKAINTNLTSDWCRDQ